MDIYTELYHHGIKGQRWGTRKYQNSDGSLTPLGRIRYGAGEDRRQAFREYGSQLKNQAVKGAKFGVALAKAKGEHYGLQAKNSIDKMNRQIHPYDQSAAIDKYNEQRKNAYAKYSAQKEAEYRAKKYLEAKKADMARLVYQDSMARFNRRNEMGRRYVYNMQSYDYIMSDPTHYSHQSIKATLPNRVIAAKTFARDGADGLLPKQISYTNVNRYDELRRQSRYF